MMAVLESYMVRHAVNEWIIVEGDTSGSRDILSLLARISQPSLSQQNWNQILHRRWITQYDTISYKCIKSYFLTSHGKPNPTDTAKIQPFHRNSWWALSGWTNPSAASGGSAGLENHVEPPPPERVENQMSQKYGVFNIYVYHVMRFLKRNSGETPHVSWLFCKSKWMEYGSTWHGRWVSCDLRSAKFTSQHMLQTSWHP